MHVVHITTNNGAFEYATWLITGTGMPPSHITSVPTPHRRLVPAHVVEGTGDRAKAAYAVVGKKTPVAKTTKPTSVQQDCYYSSSERPKNKKMY